MTLVYSFFIVFLFLMLAIISVYKTKNNFLEAINEQITKDIGITKSKKSTLINKLLIDNVVMPYESIEDKILQPSTASSENGLFYIDSKNKYMDIIDENFDGYSSRIYFFRGNVNNNYVLFGQKFARKSDGYIDESSIKQMCWKIIRTNENDSIRLAYSGTYDTVGGEEKCVENNASIGEEIFDDSSNSYSHSDNVTVIHSNVRNKLEEWYKQTNFLFNSNLKYTTCNKDENPGVTCKDLINLQSMMSDAMFCNGNGSDLTIASFKCKPEENRYTLSQYNFGTSTSNVALTYPIGLLTKDDVVFAGGSLNNSNKKFYLNYNKNYWTMSKSLNTNELYYVSTEGKMQSGIISNLYNIIPVITIKPSVETDSGSGFADDPYVLGE